MVEDRTTLRVVTFNIHHGADAAGVLDLERIGHVLEQLRPDLALLQEVDRFWPRSGGVDQAAVLAGTLGLHAAFAPAMVLPPDPPGGPDREYGHMILSRWPLEQVHRIPLPCAPDEEPRMLLHARAAVPGGPVTIAGTHLDPASAEVRLAQVRAIIVELPGQGGPVILAGDLNEAPGADSLALLQLRLSDAWEQGGDGGDGLTFVGDGADPHAARIDHILMSGFTCTAACVAEAGRGASDHLPLLAELRML